MRGPDGGEGMHVCTRRLMYRHKVINLPGGTQHSFLDGDEKSIDVRIALDMIRLAHSNEYDVAVIFSQDQDLSEASDEVRAISMEQDRWIKCASAFPYSSLVTPKARGIERTEWIRIDKATYDACLDAREYRPKKP